MDKRRFFSKLYIVLLTCLLILPCSKDANGADWTWFGKGQNSFLLFFYDSESINFLSNNIIRVWVKIIPESEEDRVRYIQDTRKEDQTIPDNWGFSTSLFEINCKNKTYTCIQSTTYSIKNELIKSDIAKYPYKEITPETIMETLSKIVCAKKDLKKERR
jgi:hypothetical protein